MIVPGAAVGEGFVAYFAEPGGFIEVGGPNPRVAPVPLLAAAPEPVFSTAPVLPLTCRQTS